jgi:hypothetical protein
MRRFTAALARWQVLSVVGGVVLLAAASAKASIVAWSCAPDGDGAVSRCTTTWSGNETAGYTLCVDETLTSSPAHIGGDFQTDTTTDPSIDFDKNVTNSTSYAWTGYTFNMYMDQAFTITAGTAPLGWTTSVTPYPTGSYTDSHGNPFTDKATVNFTNVSGANVAIGDTATFGSTVSFGGFTLYTFELEQFAAPGPVPEPATLALIGLSGLPLLLRRRRNA